MTTASNRWAYIACFAAGALTGFINLPLVPFL